jgi:hypothetical protein
MLLSSILKLSLKLSLAILIILPLVMATEAVSQQTKRHANLPKNQPWQKALEQLYPPNNSQSELDRAKGVLYRDPGRVIGLPSNAIRRPTSPSAPVVAPVTLAPSVSRLDTNRDGAISRSEYIQGRSRQTNFGFKANRLSQRHSKRLSSQFRDTDLNRDGKVTAQELQTRGSGRF